MKSRIIRLLANQKIVSGEVLSQRLNVSRVTIWKHIQKLRQAGYDIISTAKGYRLINAPDALYAWEFPDREGSIRYFEEIPSTMEAAKDLARGGCPAYTVVVAERQTNGKGRLKRKWHSERGGLYFTLVLRPDIPPIMMSKISFAASLCLSRILERDFNIDARVKWPNDLLVDGRKLSGMLCEMDVEKDMVSFLNIGVGVNVNNDPEKWEPNAVSMKRLVGKPVNRQKILSAFLTDLEQELSKDSLDHVIPEWKKRTMTLNRQVKVVTTTDTVEGKAIDVDENGALILELADGSAKKIYLGDCFFQPE